MSTMPLLENLPPSPWWRHAIAGGVVAGSLDLVYICTVWALNGVGPMRILQSVAAGWLGREAAVAGGRSTAALGLVSHYLIAIAMAAVFVLAASWRPLLVRRPLLSGALYGIVLYLAMNFVVVPLSAAGTGVPRAWTWMDLSHLAAHMFLVGVPCAWFARKALAADRSAY